MTQRTVLFSALVAVGVLTGLAELARPQSAYAVELVPRVSRTAPETRKPQTYESQSEGMLKGVLEPLHSLQIMQHALALSSDQAISEVPSIALLGSTLQTTGLGPIHIGMSLNQLADIGITLEPLEPEAKPAECRFYRIKDSLEPLGFMAVEGRIIRVDVWPGSLIATRSGIAIGSSEADIYKEYGQRIEATPNPITQGKTLTFTPQDPGEDIYRIVFDTDAQGRVVQYRAGQFPSVTWAEGCL